MVQTIETDNILKILKQKCLQTDYTVSRSGSNSVFFMGFDKISSLEQIHNKSNGTLFTMLCQKTVSLLLISVQSFLVESVCETTTMLHTKKLNVVLIYLLKTKF